MGEAVKPAGSGPAIHIERGNAADAWGPRLARGADRFVPRIASAGPGVASRAPAVVPIALDPDFGAARDLPAREKAAFTLRLDPVRHARLKQACGTSSRSAQQIVTQALDAFFAATGGPALTPSLAGAPRTGGF